MANIFTTRKPKRFEHKPRFSDPRKEALEARVRKVKRELGMLEEDELKPEETLRGTFVKGTTHLRRRQERDEADGGSPSNRYVKLAVWLIVLTVLLIWIFRTI